MERQDGALVFGLDIGTRNVVGTVGYKQEDEFYVVAQCNVEHETRSMLDGQIHDIGRVGRTIGKVKEQLEELANTTLSDVCIAAAGRVLKTEEVRVEYEFPEEQVVTSEDIHNLELMGVEEAQRKLNEENDTKFRFYCVGYSVVRYYLNDDPISNLESHKAEKITADVIATFLPEDVVDGLYSAVNAAGLEVANLTLEPIAAINVAIPEAFRLLNIALVDVGAGTSDISITKDGSIIAYGMIPHAGDEITELLVQHYLVDFKTAEHIKRTSTYEDTVVYKDIMMLEHKIPSKEVWELVEPLVDKITTEVANKIIELNGDQSVSACFVVGGGGKVHGFTSMLADKLEIAKERVALRGEEVLQKVHFEQEEIEKDPLIVTPVGICLNYYDQTNNFIFVRFNGERMKLYDNNKLTVMDAAMQAGFPTEQLFPRRGTEINFTVNGKPRIARGESGESAIVKVNGKQVSLSTPIYSNVEIEIIPSTEGSSASCTIEDLQEYTKEDIAFVVNGRTVVCPKFVEVNGSLEPSSYEVKEGDQIILRNYYTVEQLCQFMDVEIDPDREILVNNVPERLETLVYENFSVNWTQTGSKLHYDEVATEEDGQEISAVEEAVDEIVNDLPSEIAPTIQQEKVEINPEEVIAINVTVNGAPIVLSGRKDYMFVDIFEHIDFDINEAHGRSVETLVNGQTATYTQPLNEGDAVEVHWVEN
ncbi:cell division protein FtsA [Lachnospiraceae bacterium XBB1006]|nr:cell division protein FtsA [Lachnospiraceae bacterium XBB1006]